MSIPSIYSSLNAQKDLKEICIQVPSSMLRTNEFGQKFIECVGRETDAKIAEMVKCMAKDVPQKTFENVLIKHSLSRWPWYSFLSGKQCTDRSCAA